jgi:uncharacterized membrane protein (TIGR02234 family)
VSEPDGTAVNASAELASSERPGSERRELAGAIGLIVLGAAGILLCCAQRWLTVTEPRLAPFGTLRVGFSGRALYPALNGLAIVALLAALLVLVSGRWPRRILGGLLCLLALLAGWYGLRALGSPGSGTVHGLLGSRLSQQSGPLRLDYRAGWPAGTVVGAVLLLVAGMLVLLRAGSWHIGLSSRYAAPAEAAKSDDPWRSLDRGEDPTISDG